VKNATGLHQRNRQKPNWYKIGHYMTLELLNLLKVPVIRRTRGVASVYREVETLPMTATASDDSKNLRS